MERADKIYRNRGNMPVVELLQLDRHAALDIGCGAGDNAALIKSVYPESKVSGITHSKAERELAIPHMDRCWVFDIEGQLPDDLAAQTFDVLLFSHVLEHVRDPAAVLAKFARLLVPGGAIVIAVPNVLSFRQRLKFLFGSFEYEPAGMLDDTHLRFFTYLTADHYLLAESPDIRIEFKGVTGAVPLWWLRRYAFPAALSNFIDKLGCRIWPNLFGTQVLIKGRKR